MIFISNASAVKVLGSSKNQFYFELARPVRLSNDEQWYVGVIDCRTYPSHTAQQYICCNLVEACSVYGRDEQILIHPSPPSTIDHVMRPVLYRPIIGRPESIKRFTIYIKTCKETKTQLKDWYLTLHFISRSELERREGQKNVVY